MGCVNYFFDGLTENLSDGILVKDILGRIARHQRIGHASFQLISAPKMLSAWPYVKTTYPMEWVNHYLQNGLTRHDPVTRMGHQSDAPFFWSALALDEAAQKLMTDAQSFGLSTLGYSVPVKSAGAFRGLFSVNAARGWETEWEAWMAAHEADWLMLAQAIQLRALFEIDPGGRFDCPLTRRELECLELVALGKTHGEIALILDLSEHTVRGYLKSIREKLDATTLAQAVAKAGGLGLL